MRTLALWLNASASTAGRCCRCTWAVVLLWGPALAQAWAGRQYLQQAALGLWCCFECLFWPTLGRCCRCTGLWCCFVGLRWPRCGQALLLVWCCWQAWQVRGCAQSAAGRHIGAQHHPLQRRQHAGGGGAAHRPLVQLLRGPRGVALLASRF